MTALRRRSLPAGLSVLRRPDGDPGAVVELGEAGGDHALAGVEPVTITACVVLLATTVTGRIATVLSSLTT